MSSAAAMRQASRSDSILRIGHAGRCRFCGTTAPSLFRKVAHTFPEALGNKRVVSMDECGGCNATFSLHEDALANAAEPEAKSHATTPRARLRDRGPMSGRPSLRS